MVRRQKQWLSGDCQEAGAAMKWNTGLTLLQLNRWGGYWQSSNTELPVIMRAKETVLRYRITWRAYCHVVAEEDKWPSAEGRNLRSDQSILWRAFQAKETTHLRPECGLSTKPMARTQSVEWRKVQEDIRKRNRGRSREASRQRNLGFILKAMGSHWRIINLEWHDYFFLNPEQLY